MVFAADPWLKLRVIMKLREDDPIWTTVVAVCVTLPLFAMYVIMSGVFSSRKIAEKRRKRARQAGGS